MADEDDEEEPAVTLGEGVAVEGAPLARIAARFMWGIEKSKIVEREGETVIRTPDGPRELGDILAEVDEPYFSTRQEFVAAVEDVIGTGPVPTAEPAPDADEAATGEEDVESAAEETDADDEDSEPDADDEAGDTIHDLLDDVTGTLDSARQSRDSGAYDRALARCREAVATAKEARVTAREDAPDRVPDTEAALDDATALQEAIQGERDARQQASDALDKAEDALDDAAGALEDRSLDDAFDSLGDADGALDDAGDAVEDHDPPDLAERGNRLGSRHDELRDRAETLRDAHRRATEALDSAEDALDDAAAALDGGSPEAALNPLDGVEETLDTARAPIGDHEFPALADRLAALEERHGRLRQQAKDARTRVPTTIPTTPRHSLSYDDIEKGDPLGSGGNADVYHATAATDNRMVELALKEPRMSGTVHTETVERMMQEAETWQQLDDHDHIVSVVDYGSEPMPWIGMEYMDGGHLGECTAEFDFDQALWTAIATTKAVRHAHRRGVAHLDLKPQNILFREVDDAWDVPKVADWGLSKHLLDHSKSVEGMTVEYGAPEQFDDEYGAVDDITDVYQLGAVFYELFTGRPPFEGKPFKVMNRIQNEEPEPPSAVADVPAELDEILLRAMATEKDDRYEDVLLLRNDLQTLSEELAGGF